MGRPRGYEGRSPQLGARWSANVSKGHVMKHLLEFTAERAWRYRQSLHDRTVAPTPEAVADLRRLDEPLPEAPTDPEAVIALLDDVGSPATMGSAGGRFFGFVVGSSLPAPLAANWLAGAWDQNAGIVVLAPIAAKLEAVAMRWMLGLLGLPPECGAGFVTCATQANFAGLAAARHALLARQAWDVETQGLFGAPPITVVVGEAVHVSVLKALTLLGLGRERVIRVPVDGRGRMRVDGMPRLDDNTIVCLQAGDVNTGAFDPAAQIIPRAKAADAWVHVDGAFGLWAAAAGTGRLDRADLPPCGAFRGRAARGGVRHPQRRGDQSSAGLFRRRRADSPRHRRDSGGGHVLGGRNRVAGAYRHANQRLVMGDHRRGCGAQPGGDDSRGGGHQSVVEPTTFVIVPQVRVVTSLPKVFSMSTMKTGPLGFGRYALKTSLPLMERMRAPPSPMGSASVEAGLARRNVTMRLASGSRRKAREGSDASS